MMRVSFSDIKKKKVLLLTYTYMTLTSKIMNMRVALPVVVWRESKERKWNNAFCY